MRNKYYTPSIEEFHVGFKCERCIYNVQDWNMLLDPDFDKSKATEQWFSIRFTIEMLDYKYIDTHGPFRVKYLDKDDIESLGFELEKPTDINTKDDISFYYTFFKDGYKLEYLNWYVSGSSEPNTGLDYEYATEHRLVKIKSLDSGSNLFSGNIKNKSELQVVLKQLGIE